MSKKTIIQIVIQILICISLLCVIWGGYHLIRVYYVDRILDVKADDYSWVYQVDSAKVEEGDFVLQGFAFALDKDSEEESFEIVLQDIDTGKNYFPSMKYMEREDVNDYFLCEYDYLQSGFIAKIKARKLELEERNYEVLIRVKGERETYQTGIYLSKGELMYTDPTKYVALDVAGTDLERIVEQGVLRVYRPDYGMYVYQYAGELYWIAESGYGFLDGDSYVQYQLDTTQIEKLPQRRLENQLYNDNIGFRFTENELLEWKCGDFRVAKKALPKEYAIEKIWTGNYIEKWIWRQEFRPFYFFD